MEKLKRGRVLENNLYMLKFLWNACPSRVVLEICEKVIISLYDIVYGIFFIKYLFDAISGKWSFNQVLILLVAAMCCGLLINAFEGWYQNLFLPGTNQVIYEYMNSKLFRKATDVELSCFENAEFYDKYVKAVNEANDRGIKVLSTISEIAGFSAVLITVVPLMLILDPAAILFIGLSILTPVIFGGIRNKVSFAYNMEKIHPTRKKDYVKRTVYLTNYAKELRLSSMFTLLSERFSENTAELIRVIRKYGIRIAIIRILITVPSMIFGQFGPMAYISYQVVVRKGMSIGDFSAMLNAIGTISWRMYDVFQNIVKLGEHGLYIENLRAFIEYESRLKSGNISAKSELNHLEIKNVSFAYAGKDDPVLKDINITINPGEKVALVGHNGAGKTTLVKLIMGLYTASSGEIRLNGRNIHEYDMNSYRKIFGTVFQDFQIFSMSVAENVLMRSLNSDYERDSVIFALEKSGMIEKVNSLKNGIDTILTREFDDSGIVFSGGENQKIAISRVFARDCEIVILDEPSSALDPIAEYKMYENMIEAARDKTIIFISHRLSTTKDADRIYTLENGRIIEEGTHSELMALNGSYCNMFTKQAEKYIDFTLEGGIALEA